MPALNDTMSERLVSQVATRCCLIRFMIFLLFIFRTLGELISPVPPVGLSLAMTVPTWVVLMQLPILWAFPEVSDILSASRTCSRASTLAGFNRSDRSICEGWRSAAPTMKCYRKGMVVFGGGAKIYLPMRFLVI